MAVNIDKKKVPNSYSQLSFTYLFIQSFVMDMLVKTR